MAPPRKVLVPPRDLQQRKEARNVLVRMVRLLLLFLGAAAGYQLASSNIWTQTFDSIAPALADASWAAVVVGALVGLALGPWVGGVARRLSMRFAAGLQRTSIYDILAGALGLLVGLLMAILATLPLPRNIPVLGEYLPMTVTVIVGYMGLVIFLRKRDELFQLVNIAPGHGASARSTTSGHKILDTSVIIDGRIADIARTGFIEGVLLIPGFVLQELQHIADSSDVLKRNRGRRGLDILNRMQKESKVAVHIVDEDFDDIAEVDAKLVRLAQLKDAKVLTNDFNLNKVAELQGVEVLNINELANAVKPVVLPGEEMLVHVIKDGKEQGQGVGYLDDGTMIVVDGGRRFIGESVGVMVTSVLQTAAGRMIFAKPKPMERAL